MKSLLVLPATVLLFALTRPLTVLGGASSDSHGNFRRRLLAPRAAAAPGAAAGISQAGIMSVLKSVEPALENAIGNLKIPDYKTKNIHLQNMRTQGFKCGSPCISLKMGSGGKLSLNLNSFELGFHLRYKVKEIITLQGACDLKIRDASGSASVSVGTSGGALQLGQVGASISPGKLDTGCHGITGAVINLVKNLFNGMIMNTIKHAGEDALKSSIKDSLGKALSGITWTLPFNDGVEADFSPQSISSSSTSLSLQVLGQVKPVKGAIPPTPGAPSTLPAWDATGNRLLQVLVSSYSFETAGATYFSLGRIQKTLTDKNVPELNTDFMSLIAPGLKQHFGSSKKPMQLRIFINAAPTMQISSKSGVQAAADVRLEFSVVTSSDQEEASNGESMAMYIAQFLGLVDENTKASSGSQVAFTLGSKAICGLSFDVATSGSHQVLQAEIEKVDLSWSVTSSVVGKVTLAKSLLNVVSGIIDKIAVPAINAVLKEGMPLPSAANLKLKDSVLSPRDGYILVASNFDFSL